MPALRRRRGGAPCVRCCSSPGSRPATSTGREWRRELRRAAPGDPARRDRRRAHGGGRRHAPRAHRPARRHGLPRGARAHPAALARCSRELKRRLRSGSVGLVVLIDYPGFNMKVAAAAHGGGRPGAVLHHAAGVGVGGEAADGAGAHGHEAAVILPFEEALLRDGRRRRDVRRASAARPRAEAMPDRAPRRARRSARRERRRCSRSSRGVARRRSSGISTLFVATARELAAAGAGAPRGRERRAGDHARPGALSVPAGARRARSPCCAPPTRRSRKSGTTTLEAAVAGCPLDRGVPHERDHLRDSRGGSCGSRGSGW